MELIPIDDPWKRAFFENECLLANWSVRQLRRQIGSLLYERTGLSANKKAVIEKARKQERQQDFTDLVFYHRILRCHVLIDLKIRPFKHGDAGQMNFYLNWWKANAVEDGDNPPVGIILCSDRDEAAVEFATAGMDQKLFVSRYLVALPSVEKLRRFLEADRERIESQMPPSSARKRAPRKPTNGLT